MKIYLYTSLAFIFSWICVQFFTPEFIDDFYRSFLYIVIRYPYSLFFKHLPFAFIYLVIPVFIIGNFAVYKYSAKATKNMWVLPIHFISTLCFLYTWFYTAWGIQFGATGLSDKLKLRDSVVDTTYLLQQMEWTEGQLLKVRSQIHTDNNTAIPLEKRPPNLEENLLKSVKETLLQWQLPASYDVRVRPLYPAGSLLIFSTAGIYLPFSMEGHYDPGLAHFHTPFVMAHELGHGYGITGEADCNFLAMVSCLRSDNAFIQYAGLLTYWRYLNADLRKSASYSYFKKAFSRPIAIRTDLELLYDALDKYPEVMPVLRDFIYDNYLKANGIKDGIQNYDRITTMFKSWKESPLDRDVKEKWDI